MDITSQAARVARLGLQGRAGQIAGDDVDGEAPAQHAGRGWPAAAPAGAARAPRSAPPPAAACAAAAAPRRRRRRCESMPELRSPKAAGSCRSRPARRAARCRGSARRSCAAPGRRRRGTRSRRRTGRRTRKPRPDRAWGGTVSDMADVLRYGIIGTGMMGLEHMLQPAAHPRRGGRRPSPIPTSRPASDGTSTRGPELAVYEDYRELLAETTVDAVVIATPNHTHADVLDGRLRRPTCTCWSRSRCAPRWRTAARWRRRPPGTPGVVWVGMEYRYMPPVARLVEEVRGRGRRRAAHAARSASTASRSCPRWATGTASRATPAAPWSRSAATSST